MSAISKLMLEMFLPIMTEDLEVPSEVLKKEMNERLAKLPRGPDEKLR